MDDMSSSISDVSKIRPSWGPYTSEMQLTFGQGYPHNGRAYNGGYWHDGHADNHSYSHNSHALNLYFKQKNIEYTSKRTLMKMFNAYADKEGHLHFVRLRQACNEMDLYPSSSQVHEMLMCAIEYGSPCKPDHITFGEFCVLVSELQNYYLSNVPCPVPRSLVRVRTEPSLQNKKNRRVFLGGSCNPTTWRVDAAIPYFKDQGITFYNPQVQQWKPELMELEAQAKQMSDVLFFVIDSKTRAISSMIEVAYLAATKRQVVVIFCEFKETNLEICGEMLTDSEMLELRKARLVLTDLLERNSIPIFSDINSALQCTSLIVKKNTKVTELTVKHGATPVKHGHLKLGQALLELREAFNSVDSDKNDYLNCDDVCLAYKCCTGEDLDVRWLHQRRQSREQFSYEDLCCIITEYKHQTSNPSFLQKVMFQVLRPVQWFMSKLSTRTTNDNQAEVYDVRDIYLGGSTSGRTTWRGEIAEPLLRKQGFTYVNPDVPNWDQKLIPIHVAMREKCRLLLYVISNDRRSLASMCEAGYYVGRGCRMVLCVQKLPSPAVLCGDTLTDNAVRDYNRGRDYLCDLANRDGIPLFEDITEAVNCAISILNSIPNEVNHT